MGRARIRSSKPSASQNPQPTVQALLAKAQSLITQCDFPLALSFVQRILQNDPDNVKAREMKGILEIEFGELDKARETFQSLIKFDSTCPPPVSALLYLAQLSDEDPHGALSYYRSAVDIFQTQLKGKGKHPSPQGDEEEESQLRKNIAAALVGMVEIWMDPRYDLCFDPAAETSCEGLLNTALQTDPGNVEVLQTFASVRMSQQRPDEAKAYLEQAWVGWKDLDLDDPRVPSAAARISLVKLCLELELYRPALQVLRGLMEEDDENVEAWYLEGWCFYLMAEETQSRGGKLEGEDGQSIGWEELARDSRDCLSTCEALITKQEYEDEQLLEHVRELIAKLEGMDIKPTTGDQVQGDDWEDIESDDVNMI